MDTTINDKQRRFSGLQRLYGDGATVRLEQAHVMVAGIGGVGSWTAEALARSGVGELTLIDLDHIAESNVNRQIHALCATLGQAKTQAMADRIAGINPDCRVNLVDDFLGPDNVDTLLQARPVSILVDATDQVAAKIAMVLASQREQIPFIMCGGAGGKLDALTLTAGDLSTARNDALLGRIRQQLRKHHGFAKGSDRHGKALRKAPAMRVFALWFDQPAILPQAWGASEDSGALQGLSCAGYGSAVTVTAAMGMAAAGEGDSQNPGLIPHALRRCQHSDVLNRKTAEHGHDQGFGHGCGCACAFAQWRWAEASGECKGAPTGAHVDGPLVAVYPVQR